MLAKELPKKFRYPVEIEPYDGTTDPKHHLDAFENRMLLVNASDVIHTENFSDLADSFMKNFTTHQRLPKTCLNLYSIVKKPEETLQSYLDRFNAECTQIEGLQTHAALMALEIQERSHDYLQQEEGQTVVKTNRNKKDNARKDQFREEKGRIEQRPNISYYNPLNISLAQFLHEVSQVERVQRGQKLVLQIPQTKRTRHGRMQTPSRVCRAKIKNEKFREYTNKYRQRDNDRRAR
ncbi:hypothetical protein PIB30_066972 [Stylosanthes scabra]|uniref:Retrotransposon gag domain-containing protein n=1 Tax=Stylosanthes scabra TaxID=79078 RepID=A0ABU6XNE4_9FABA|nr:hypothetical protein [Stylosanthes scabra]